MHWHLSCKLVKGRKFMFTRHIDVKNNLVFINELENVSMDLSRLPEDVTFYIEINDY